MQQASALVLVLLSVFTVLSASQAKPNVIYILADDLGYGDIGPFGQKVIRTPHLDKMAKRGMRFTQHYSGSTVCAPSRSSLMTGLHTGHTPIRGNREIQPEGQAPLPKDTYTLPKMFKAKGYVTGAFGKWGLGYPGSEGSPNNQGFDEFFGYNCQRLAHNYYPYFLRHNDEKVVLKGNEGRGTAQYGPDVIQEKTLEFIKKHKDEPFFLYVPHVLPHAELLVPDDAIRQSYLGKFEEQPHKGYDEGPMYRKGPYGSTPTPKTDFAAMITRLDMHVGQIVDLVEELGLLDNTLIVFTSDNGPHKEGGANPEHFDSNGIYKGMKRDLYEGGVRVPTLFQWSGHVPVGSSTNFMSCFWDMMATFADLTDTPLSTYTDGISIMPTLRGEQQSTTQRDTLYWEFYYNNHRPGKKALRQGDWKLISNRVFAEGPENFELYNIRKDPSENDNVAQAHPERVKEMAKLMKNSHRASEVFKFGSKADQNKGKKKKS